MGKGSFEERAAHLSYVAPLIALLIERQVGHAGAGAGLVAFVLVGGLVAAVTGWRAATRGRAIRSWPALLGAIGTVVAALSLWGGD